MTNIRLATLTAAALLPLQSYATPNVDSFQLRTGEDLVYLCSIPEADLMAEAARDFCYGFLSGVNAFHQSVNAGQTDHLLYCLPKGKDKLTRSEAAKMYVDWSRENAQYLSESPVDNLMRFAIATWPCN